MELGGSLPHSQEFTTCPYPNQINPFPCLSHFCQAQIVSFLVGLRTYQYPCENSNTHSYKVKGENQQDATNTMFIIKLSVSTCFGHHYAHHQENKTVHYCIWCSAWVCRLWLVVVLWSCFVHDPAPHDHNQPQPTHPGRTPHATGHGLILLMMGIMMSETCWDRKFDNKHRVSCILFGSLSSPYVHDARSQEPKSHSHVVFLQPPLLINPWK